MSGVGSNSSTSPNSSAIDNGGEETKENGNRRLIQRLDEGLREGIRRDGDANWVDVQRRQYELLSLLLFYSMRLLKNTISKLGLSLYWAADKYINSTQNVKNVISNKCGSTFYRQFGYSIQKEHSIGRDWLVQLWLSEKRKEVSRRKWKQKRRSLCAQIGDTASEAPSFFQLPYMRSVFSKLAPDEHETQVTKIVKQPPNSQYDGSFLAPHSSEEVKLVPLLARDNLVITRDVEWGNIMFAFEQESRYVILDPFYPQSPVGSIREQSNVIFRQLLRTRRPFVARITDAMGNEIFRIRRPFWLINSTIYAEVNGKEVGVVHRRWHLWRRIYDLYLGSKQFAVVENPGFWNWTFTLKDEEDNVLAQIDRDWRGFGFELFTDAGQYVIRFGDADSNHKSGLASQIEALEVARPLTLSERAVAVALAVSLDSDYFSRKGGGWGLPILIAGE